jgi:hypothetical protein
MCACATHLHLQQESALELLPSLRIDSNGDERHAEVQTVRQRCGTWVGFCEQALTNCAPLQRILHRVADGQAAAGLGADGPPPDSAVRAADAQLPVQLQDAWRQASGVWLSC